MIFKLRSFALILVVVLLSLSALAADLTGKAAHGIVVANIDRSVAPGDDFYRYANGSWIKRTEIPPDRGAVNVFSMLADLTDKRTSSLIEEIAKSNAPAGSASRKIADLYNSYMDEAAIESKGLGPLQARLKAIAEIKDKRELAFALGETLRADVDPLNNAVLHTPNLFGLWVAPGFNDPDHYNAYLLQGGLAMPDREYYLANDSAAQEVRTKYLTYIANMLKLAGFTDSEARAKGIFELELSIANVHLSLADNDDIHKANNTWKQADFAIRTPGLDWREYFRGAGLIHQDSFIVWQPTAFSGESALVASTPLVVWKDWLAFHLLDEYANVLPKSIDDEHFAFTGTALQGTLQQRPRWWRSVRLVNTYLGDDVGQLYVQRYFPPEAKAEAQKMVANIIAAFRKRIDALSWMAPETKAEAQAKLTTLYVGIGYPETWRDYSGYDVKSDDLFGNVWRARLFEYHRETGRLGKPVDRHEWCMPAQIVNAVNLPLQNALNFPAAILQPPFFDAQAPAAFNYGAIGSVIGHEISHTFDTEGSTFDSRGAVRNWWTDSDLAHFQAATTRLAEQYNNYKPFPDLSVNGKQTLGENVADVAGIAAAFDGYRASLQGGTAEPQDGIPGDKQFFIAFAQNWGTVMRPALLCQRVLTDGHSPAEYRADTVRNVDAWYAAFDVKPGEKLYLAPADRVQIW